MKVQVTINNVQIKEKNILNENEYNIHECEFEFTDEYNGLTKKAVFTGDDGKAYVQTIQDDKCTIPSEILARKQRAEIGVYAYDLDNEELLLRYSPRPTEFYIHEGSYKEGENTTPPTPSEVEQLQSQITTNANNIEELQECCGKYDSDIEEIKAEQITQNENIQNNTETIGTITENITIINEALGTINENIGDLQEGQIEQNTKIQKNADDIIEINQDINEIDSSINTINQNIDDLEQDLTNYSLITETGSQINLNINSSNFQMTAILKDKNGNVIHTSNVIDLPLETMVVGASYDNVTKEVVLTLQNGTTLRFSVADLVSGLVSETQLQTILANYYTKTEVNNLLSAKANQASLDTTNQNLTTLTERVSTNEEDISDIKSEQTTQNTNIEELQNQVETLQEDLDNANAEIEELNTDITNMRKASYKVKGEGTDITLENTSNNKFVELGLNGNTEQEQLTGKNLFNRDAKDRGWQLTKENYQNGIKLISTNNSGVCYILYEFPFNYNEIKDIYLNFQKTGNGFVNIYFKDIDNNDTKSLANQQNPFTLTNIPATTTKVVLYFYGSTANTGDVTIFDNIQLELGSTATSYEPYTNGLQTPNPNYIEPIKNVTGNANVKICNANLNDEEYENGMINDDGSIGTETNRIHSKNFINIKSNTDYTFSIIGTLSGMYYYMAFYDTNKNIISKTSANSQSTKTFTFTTPANAKYIRIGFSYASLTSIETIQTMLNAGTTATSYVEHQEQNYPLTLGDIELCKINTAQDYFYKENNKWYKHQEIGKVIYDGSNDENWALDNVGVGQFSIFVLGVTNAPIYSNFFGYKLTYSATGKPYIRPVKNKFYLELGTEMLPEVSVSALRAWLSTHNTEIYYILETPTETEITDTTLIGQLEATLQAISYYEQTNISGSSDELSPIITASAVGDLNLILNN